MYKFLTVWTLGPKNRTHPEAFSGKKYVRRSHSNLCSSAPNAWILMKFWLMVDQTHCQLLSFMDHVKIPNGLDARSEKLRKTQKNCHNFVTCHKIVTMKQMKRILATLPGVAKLVNVQKTCILRLFSYHFYHLMGCECFGNGGDGIQLCSPRCIVPISDS